MQSKKVTTTTIGSKVGLDLSVISGVTIDGGALAIVGQVSVNITDAGAPLNINPPASLPLPTGAATATKQDTGNASLSSIDGKLPALSGGKVPVDIGASIVSVTGGLTDTQLRASPVPVSLTSTTITGTVAATESGTWTVQPGNTANTTPWLLKLDQTTTNNDVDVLTLPNVTIGTFPDNEPFNIAQMNGVTVQMGTGASGTGTQRVILSTDSALAANQSVNVAQVGGAATSTAASGVQKVGVVGSAGAAVDAAQNAAAPANVVAVGLEVATQGTTQPTAATAGNVRRQLEDGAGVAYVHPHGPVSWSCFVQAVTVMTQCRAAPAAGIRAYVNTVVCDNQAATVQGVDVVFGTGSNCATVPTGLTHKFQMGTNATTTSPDHVQGYFPTPLVPTAANAICVRPTAATAFGCTLTGYDAP